MNEKITSAFGLLFAAIGDLSYARSLSEHTPRPEGPTVADRATTAYLQECLELAHALSGKLALIAD